MPDFTDCDFAARELRRRIAYVPQETFLFSETLASIFRIDDAALAALVEFHVESGTDGIVAVGTTGESATLDHTEHGEVIARVVELAAGRLVRPFSLSLPTEYAYYLVCPKDKAEQPKIAAFRDWLLAEVAASSEAGGAAGPRRIP